MAIVRAGLRMGSGLRFSRTKTAARRFGLPISMALPVPLLESTSLTNDRHRSGRRTLVAGWQVHSVHLGCFIRNATAQPRRGRLQREQGEAAGKSKVKALDLRPAFVIAIGTPSKWASAATFSSSRLRRRDTKLPDSAPRRKAPPRSPFPAISRRVITMLLCSRWAGRTTTLLSRRQEIATRRTMTRSRLLPPTTTCGSFR